MGPSAQSYARAGAIVLLLAAIALYSYSRAENLIRGPRLTITEPANGATVADALVEVAGTAANVAHIRMNGRTIFTDEAGAFREKLLLPYGYTILTIEAEDRFGRRTEKALELVYK